MKKFFLSVSKIVSDQTQQLFIIFCAIGITSWVFFLLPKMAAEYLFESNSSPFLQALWFIVVIPVVIFCVWLITSEHAVKTDWIKPNVPSLIVIGFILYAISGLFFSTVVYILAKNEWVLITPIDGRHTITISSLIDLFMWHFLEAIPSLHINDLLKFKEPYDFDGRVGALVLIFQLSVIFPIIKFYKKVNSGKDKTT